MLPWTPFALQHHGYIGLDRAGERKKESLGCKTNQVFPITERLLGNDFSCAEAHRLRLEQTEYGEGIFVDRAIEDAAFILERRLSDWPSFEPYAKSVCGLHRLTCPKDDEACSEIAHLYLSYPKRFPQTSCV